ncbi:MAG: beta-lactamase family protein [Ignavibacteriaceae bacterium]|nr:beta-lactamase family protein [Ignavibacteriaceae bacterium]
MSKTITIILIFSICLFVFCNNSSEEKLYQSVYDFSEVERVIKDAIEKETFPGAVVLVWKDGKTIFQNPFGHFTYHENSDLVTLNTIYDLASLTKVLATTTATMICVDKNLFNLENKVSEYIPYFGSNEKENVTIKNLLLHNSGLPSWNIFYNKNLTEEEILYDIYNSEIKFQPGTKTLYSDLGMIVLGKVIEKASNKSLDEFCKEKIFIPLKMNNTFFNPPDSVKDRIPPTEVDNYWRMRLIKGEVHDENASLLDGAAGHAGLFSTAEDICKLLEIIMFKGKASENQLIKKETIALFTSENKSKNERLLGWDLKSATGSSAGSKFSKDSFGHTGFTGTSIWIDPARNLFVVFLTNRVYPSRENKKILQVRPKLHDAVIDAIERGQ